MAADAASATITINPITGDNIISNQELTGVTTIGGTITANGTSTVNAGETVTLTVNGHPYTGTVVQDPATHLFSYSVANVAMSDLVVNGVAQQVSVSVLMTDANGSHAPATMTDTPTIDTASATITITPITGDNDISLDEAQSTYTTVSGTVGGNAQFGDAVTLTVNGHTYATTVTGTAGNLVYSATNVPTTDLTSANHTVTATVSGHDAAGSTYNASATDTPTFDALVVGTSAGETLVASGGGNDILVGDPGGTTLIPGQSANIVLVLDTSGSMGTNTISFTNSSGKTVTETRLQAMINSVDATLNQLHTSGATVLVHIDQFSTNASSVGTFNVSTTAGLNAAVSAVNALTATNSTNYEAGLQSALGWINSTGTNAPLANANVNKLVFISDGQPNELDNNTTAGAETTTAVSATAAQAIAAALGTLSASGSGQNAIHADSISEVGLIAAAGYNLQAVGIQVGSGMGTSSSPSALGFLSELEGYNYGSVTTGHTADNITTANDLSNTIGTLTGSQVIQTAVGNDVINGGSGNDIIFGDSVNTDALATANAAFYAAHNLLMPPAGAGALVFTQLGWSQTQIYDYVIQNLASSTPTVQLESGRTGGNDMINGGAGNDIIFGQEGNDIISGGAGNDIMYGGTGANTFVWHLADAGTTAAPALDKVMDFKAGDVLQINDLLSDPAGGAHIAGAQTTTSTTLNITDTAGHAQTIVLQGFGSAHDLTNIINSLTTAHSYTGV